MECQSSDEEIIDLEIYINPLKGKQCFFNWVSPKFDEAAAIDRIEKRQCKKKCSYIEECDYCEIDGDWRSEVNPTMFFDRESEDSNKKKGYFHKFVSWNGEFVFLEAYIGEYEKAEKRLIYMDRKIDEYCLEDENKCDLEYVDGFKYMSVLLKAFIQFRQECFNCEEIAKLKSFDDLPTTVQNAVLSVKFNFLKEYKGSLRIKIATLRKLIQLDPRNPSWFEKPGLHLRIIQKETWKGQGMRLPIHEETSTFLQAFTLKRDEPKFFVALCRNIGEILKAKKLKYLNQVVEIDCTRHLFKTVEEALDFMKRNTMLVLDAVETLEKNRDTAKVITTLGEVFSVSLPYKFLDLDLAEKCIETAIQVSPDCSKANHRMGLFQWTKRNNFDLALTYLTTAVSTKNENFFAVVDWLQLLLHEADERAEFLHEIFDQILSDENSWAKNETAKLQFVKGCFLFLVNGNETETINSWVSAYAADRKAGYFTISFIEAHRFKWDKNEWNYDRLIAFLRKYSSCKVTKRMFGDLSAAKQRQKKMLDKKNAASEKMAKSAIIAGSENIAESANIAMSEDIAESEKMLN